MTKRTALALALTMGSLPALAGPRRSEAELRRLSREFEMEALVRSMFESLGLPNKVPVVIDPLAEKGCAYATTANGKQFIGVYLPCTGPLRLGKGYNWNAIGILAHEVCHLLAGDTTDSDHSPRDEAEADEFAGWQLRRMGATLEEAQTTFRKMSATGSHTHPPRAERLLAVERGWNRAGSNSLPIPQPAPLPPSEHPTIAQDLPTPTPQPVPLPPLTRPQPTPAPPVRPKGWWEDLMSKRLPWAR